MSLCDNKTSKIYPDLSATAPQEPQGYIFKKFTEIEAYLLDEIEVRERPAKKTKRFNTVTGIVDTGLIASRVITGAISISAFTSGVGLPLALLQVELAYFFLLQQQSHGNLLKPLP